MSRSIHPPAVPERRPARPAPAPAPPAIRVVESKRAAKRGDLVHCEDSMAATDDYAAVFDGATSNGGPVWGGATAGRLAARVLAEAVLTLDPDAEPDGALRHLEAALRTRLRRLGCYQRARDEPLDRPCAVMAVYSRARREVWRVGDSQALLVAGGKVVRSLGGATPVEASLASVRARVNARARRAGRSIEELRASDPGRAQILDRLRALRAFENRDDAAGRGTSVISGFGTPGIEVEPVPDIVDEVVLATDGYPVLWPDLARTERHLAERIARDPLMIDHPSATKGVLPGAASYDDRAYLRIACPGRGAGGRRPAAGA